MKIKKSNKSKIKNAFDKAEKNLVENYELLNLPLVHRFTDGLYVREMSAPSGCLITSKIHKEQHQFFVLKGKIIIWDEEGNEQMIQAPYIGVTQANTRRIGYVVEDVVWATSHPNPENKVLEELENEIFENPINNLIDNKLLDKIKNSQLNSKNNSKIIDNLKNNLVCQQ